MTLRCANALLATLCLALWLRAQAPEVAGRENHRNGQDEQLSYLLGPNDQVNIWVPDADDIFAKPFRIDSSGYVSLPMVGSIHASGMTVRAFESELTKRLKTYMKRPQVAVSVAEFKGQPVSVLGAVNNPGVHQLQGHKTLIEVLSMAGGMRQDAGYVCKIVRRMEWGRLPLPGEKVDDGAYSVAELSIESLMAAEHPEQNITIRPHDVVTVPRADLVYVVGEVERAGGFPLHERKSITVLQALSLAGGIRGTTASKKARILRETPAGGQRQEIEVNLAKLTQGAASDITLQPQDILFVPVNAPKRAALRATEAAIQMVTGIAIWRSAR